MSHLKKRFIFFTASLIVFFVGVSFVIPALSSRSSEIYEKIKTLNQIISIVNENYVEPVDWDEVLDGAFHGMLEKLDPHSSYIPKKQLEVISEQFHGKFEGIGIEFDILGGYITVISPIVGSPSDRAGLQPGDQIIEIEYESAYKITKEEVFEKLRGPKGSSVNITVSRIADKKPFEVEIIRDEIPIYSVTSSFMLDHETGYIQLRRFSSTTSQEVSDALNQLRGEGMTQLIFDLRTNSGGYLEQAVDVTDNFFVSSDTIVYTEGRRSGSRKVYRASSRKGDEDYALVVLIDRWSASASEIVAGAIQDLDRGLIVGETSFGKGLVQQQWILNDDSALRVTIGRYYTPSGRLIQRPYGDGTHEYYRELADENREARLDSLITDRPRYKTKSGREVYGGGGITPDVFVALENRSPEARKLLRNEKRITFNWGTEIASDIRSDWLSESAFIEGYHVSEDQLSSFFDYAIQGGVSPINNEALEKDIPYLKVVLKAEIAGAIWGRGAYFQVLVSGDSQVMEARKLFGRARAFLTINSG